LGNISTFYLERPAMRFEGADLTHPRDQSPPCQGTLACIRIAVERCPKSQTKTPDFRLTLV
jgi:hypothetical protein